MWSGVCIQKLTTRRLRDQGVITVPCGATAGASGVSDKVKRSVPLVLACAALKVKRSADEDGVIDDVNCVPCECARRAEGVEVVGNS